MPATVVVDASVAVKWFHSRGESEVEEAHALLAGHERRTVRALVLDLTAYELGNVLVRRLRWSAEGAIAALDALDRLGPPIVPAAEERRLAVQLAADHGLTLYDAAYAAVARQRGMALVTADRRLLAAGLGTGPAELAAELGLYP